MKLKKSDIEIVKKSIEEAEKKTSGEIVPVLISKSDSYIYTHYLCSLIFTFIGLFLTKYSILQIDISEIIIVLTFSFIGLALPLISPIKKLLLSKREVEEEVNQRTLQAFYENQLHQTKDGTGVMIFISLLEKRVNIIGDWGINSKVSQSFWDDEIKSLTEAIRNKNIATGLSQVINDVGSRLAENFPIQSDDENELKNELITDLDIV